MTTGYVKIVKNTIIPALLLGITLAILVFLLYLLRDYLIIIEDAKYLIFASFGSSAFIMYMMPESSSSRISKFAKSYVAASLIGYSGLYMSGFLGVFATIAIVETLIAIVMVSLKAEHPPAAAIGIVFTINRVGLAGILIIVIGVITVSLLSLFLKKAVILAKEEEEKMKQNFANKKYRQ
jgi:CBS-domain-containing membrane protein